MKIAQVVPIWVRTPPVKYGGSEMICSLLTEALVELGHDVTLFASGDAVTKAKLVHIFDGTIGIAAKDESPTFAHFANAFSRSKEFDIIHSHGGIFGMQFAPLIKTPVVATMHNVYVPPGTPAFQYFKDKVNYVAISRSQKKICDGLNVADVVYNAIAIDDYKMETKKDDYLFWIGNCVSDKGPDIAIKAAKQLGIKLIMAGKIDWNLKTHVQFFEEEIKPHIDGKNIIFHEEITREEKAKLFEKAKCFLFPIRWDEPFGMVMAEANASGTPVVAFPGGAVPEVIKDKETGYIVKTYDEFVASVKNVLDGKIDPKKCRKHVEDNFSPAVMAKNYAKVYEKILAKSGR